MRGRPAYDSPSRITRFAESVTWPREGEGQRTPGDPFTSDSIISVASHLPLPLPLYLSLRRARTHYTGGLGTRRRMPECRVHRHHIRNTRLGSRRVVAPAIYLPNGCRGGESKVMRRLRGREIARSTCSHKPRNIHFARARSRLDTFA